MQWIFWRTLLKQHWIRWKLTATDCCRGIQEKTLSVQTNSSRISPLVTTMIWRHLTVQKSSFPAAARVYCVEQHYTHCIFCILSKATAPAGQNTGQEAWEGLFVRNSMALLNEAHLYRCWLCLSVTATETANTVQFSSGVCTELGTEVLLSWLQPPDITVGQTW